MDSRLRGDDFANVRLVTTFPVHFIQQNAPPDSRHERAGVFRARLGDCLTYPGIKCLTIAPRPKCKPVFEAAMVKLYEAGEGVSASLARNATARGRTAPCQPPQFLFIFNILKDMDSRLRGNDTVAGRQPKSGNETVAGRKPKKGNNSNT